MTTEPELVEGVSGEETEAPGWYPDPDDPSRERYWDGEGWGARDRMHGRANRLAVTALICATCVPFLLVSGILAIAFGTVALDEIDDSAEASKRPERGRGFAQWAIWLGALNIVLSCAVIAVVVVVLVK